MRALVLLLLFGTQCRAPKAPDASLIRAPTRVVRALTQVSDLSAEAQLVPRDGDPKDAVNLTRGTDGVSFSGFLPASPGAFTLEVVFTGLFEADRTRHFLGRWVSDAFTVARGDTVTPVFSKPLDTIGRPSDGGDEDSDGLGLLDELLWQTDPNDDDSDNDGVLDGRDCSPNNEGKSFTIVGTIEDCDGDGVTRPDLPYGDPGVDCNDTDPAIHPGAEDLCSDEIDQDCNPETCPRTVDETGPAITIIEPTAGSTIGCQRQIVAEIEDPAGVASAELDFVDGGSPPQVIQTITMNSRGNNRYEIAELETSTNFWLENGTQRYVIRATDDVGNRSDLAAALQIRLDVPSATVTPTTVGPQSAPFDLVVDATSPNGIASVALLRAPLHQDGSVDRQQEAEVDRRQTVPATFTIDPSPLADGDYAFYPIVEDVIGNRLQPEDEFTPDDTPQGLSTPALFDCLFDVSVVVPVRRLTVGAPAITPAKMRDHYAEAVALAATRDPQSVLVEIRGWGLGTDGLIRLDLASGGPRMWQYSFLNFTDDRFIEITWWSVADATPSPEIEVQESYPFTATTHPIAQPDLLVDSDVATTAYHAVTACPALTGHSDDDIRYESNEPFSSADVIRISARGASEYLGTAVPPVTDIWQCN